MKARTYLSSSAVFGMLVLPGVVMAQTSAGHTAVDPATGASQVATPAPAAPQSGLEEIVVTAQRRSENLQKVPIAISAVSATQLAASGVKGIDTIRVAVPGLTAQNSNGVLTMFLRGVGTNANGPGFENPVSLYIDGVYIGNQTVGLLQFNNIERIEVLKGPQGTLFGRNATGGLVQIITRDPSQGSLFTGSVSYGNYNSVEAQAYGGGKLADNLAADLAVRYASHDGYGTNIRTGGEAYASKYDIALRSKIVWSPGDFKFTLIGDYATRDNSLNSFSVVPGTLAIGNAGPASYPNPWDINADLKQRVKVKDGGVSLKTETELGTISVSNLLAYRHDSFFSQLDYDSTPTPVVNVFLPSYDWQLSDELQFASPKGGRFTWVAGAFYYRGQAGYTSQNPSDIQFFGFPFNDILIVGKQDTYSISGFAQGTFNLTDKIGITGGVRYSSETRHINGYENITLPLPGNPQAPYVPLTTGSVTFSQPTFRAALNYKPNSDVLLYASFNTGFKSGGYSASAPADPAYRPEKLTAYEIGEKAELFNRVLRLNSAAFYYDYKDIQVQQFTAAGTSTLRNGSKARIYGFDLDATLAPGRGLQFNAGLSLLHAKYLDYNNAPIGTPSGGVPVSTGSAAGKRLPNAPNAVFNVGGTYTIPIGSNELVANGVWLHSSTYFFEADNIIRQRPYDLFNASLTFNLDGGRYSVAAFGNNLTNQAVISGGLTIPSLGSQLITLLPPRTYGVRAGFRF